MLCILVPSVAGIEVAQRAWSDQWDYDRGPLFLGLYWGALALEILFVCNFLLRSIVVDGCSPRELEKEEDEEDLLLVEQRWSQCDRVSALMLDCYQMSMYS